MNLKGIRNQKGLTQKQVAEGTGISLSNYKSYELRRCDPNVAVIKKLAAFFGVSTDYLLADEQGDYMFEPATMRKTEVQEVFDKLTPYQQQMCLSRMYGYLDANNESAERYKIQKK